MSRTVIIIAVVAILCSIVLTLGLTRRLLRNVQVDAPMDPAEAEELIESGRQARATIVSIEPTGVILNRTDIKCNVGFRFEPLDGAAGFEGNTTMFINQTQMPRVGDVWPSWFEASEPSKFHAVPPNLDDPQTRKVLDAFGISNPLKE